MQGVLGVLGSSGDTILNSGGLSKWQGWQGSFFLMTNHVHLIVKPEQGSNLSRVNGEMRRRYIRMIKLSIVSPKFWAAACNSIRAGSGAACRCGWTRAGGGDGERRGRVMAAPGHGPCPAGARADAAHHAAVVAVTGDEEQGTDLNPSPAEYPRRSTP